MGKTGKILIATSAVIVGAAAVIIATSRRLNKTTETAISNLMHVQLTLAETKREVIRGNDRLAECSSILRKLVKDVT